jgi:class 3 adenylate cyclase/tetratricopeptide (TPR) repeat protein
MSTQCTSCGFNNPPGMKFCGNCGTRLAVTSGLLGTAASEAPSITPEQMGVMMGADLLERFRQAGLEAAGQRRNVTVLFADISGYTALSHRLDPEEVYHLIQQFSQLLAADVYKYDGTVDKFTGDGLMAVFGAPIAHENNAERAVRAALDMQADVTRLSEQVHTRVGVELRVRIGLNNGTVIVGSVGSNMMMNYTAIGDTVNLASRLEQAATPGTILASESVYRLTKAVADFQPTPPLNLKGIEHPVVGYQMLRLKDRPSSVRGVEGLQAPLVGREAELNQLRQVLAELAERGRGRFVLLTGEAGIGKTRLSAEFKALAASARVRVLEGQSLTYRRSVAYWMFLDVLRGYLGISVDTPDKQVRERLRQTLSGLLGDAAGEALPFLESLFSLPPSEAAAEQLRFLNPSQLRQQVFLAVRDVLLAEARRQPLIVVLDDLHWADEASLDLLLFLLDTVLQAPLLLYGISRPFQEGPLAQILARAQQRLADRLNLIHLQSLTPNQSQQLLQHLLATTDLPPALREQVLQRAAGVPFYLEEVLRMLIEAQLLQHTAGGWRVTASADIAALGVPETLQGLILARFDRLNETQRRVLQTASVIGRNFSWGLLKAILHSFGEQNLQATLTQLAEREYIEPDPDAPGLAYVFKHVLVSDVIYGAMLKRDRSELHGQVGAAIESEYAGQLDAQIELLARHFSWSPRLDRALHYLILAGQKAARGYANAQARQHFEQALALLPQIPHQPYQALQVRMGLGDVLVLIGEYSAAQAQFQAALDGLAGEDPNLYAKERSALERKMGTALSRQGDYDRALLCLASAQRALGRATRPLPVERAHILNDTGWLHFLRGNLSEAEKILKDGLGLVEGTPNADIIATLYNSLGGVYFQKGELMLAADYVRKSLTQRQAMGDRVGVARSYNNLGLLSWRRGHYDAALDSFWRAQKLLEKIGDVEALAFTYSNLGLLLTDRGELEAALEHLNHSLEAARRIGHPLEIARAHINLARAHLSRGEPRLALTSLDESRQLFRNLEAQENLIDVCHLMGECWAELGNLDQAQDWAQQGRDLALDASGVQPKQSTEYARILRLLGKVAMQRGDYAAAEQFFLESSDIFELTVDRLELGRTQYQSALLAQRRGDRSSAVVLLHHARSIFDELGAKGELSRVEERLAQLKSGSSPLRSL